MVPSKNTSPKIPKLRFREFQGEWEERNLEQLSGVFRSGTGITSESIFESGLYPVYGGNGLRGYTNNYTHDGFYILIGRQGAWCGNIKRTQNKVYISEHAIAVQGNNISDTEWLGQRLDYFNLNRLSEAAAQPGLAVNKLLKVKIFVPQRNEQQKIASFLSTVDEKIEKLKTKKSLLEKYKKGMMQKIFAREIRFRDENGEEFGEWQEKELSKIGDTFNGLSGKTKEDFGIGKKYITYKQIFDNSIINITKCERVSISEGENQNQVQYGDFFFTVSSETPDEIGMSSVLLDRLEDCYLNSFCFGFRVFSVHILDPLFGSFLFRSKDFRKQIVQLAQGSTRYNMSKVQFLNIRILLPSFPEQQRVASFLSEVDKKINVVSLEIENTEKWKKGLLQQMFV